MPIQELFLIAYEISISIEQRQVILSLNELIWMMDDFMVKMYL